MQLELKQLIIPPGNVLQLKDISWQMFEQILDELGESRAARVSYSKEFLEIMAPLPEHEDDKAIIGDFVKAILEQMDIEFRDLGSTTFKKKNMSQGVEADTCFYIQNEAAIRGKKKIDLTVDPPPDLAIEIDITSRTALNNYEALGVTELWRYNGQRLQINVLQDGKYIESENSRIFSQFSQLREVIHRYVEESKVVGRNATMKAFKNWVRAIVN
ncbi:Uma2 family endonuclease [Argonema antarcticum]|uniref:Uma2 family endonuclease n=1 Tax=Argonema antarcticum TaxID=2942763 RepID=UPI0020124F68|nr:Uma2 family endonuclease [Argonema antarcticum]MCL1472972.1 Uma2 family endonuclease [Argonema antarcticum A004/B2]